jgi:glycolate oxidase FAD binding subunit
VLDLSPLNAITSYEPNELIITVQAGAPLSDVMSLIDSKNQQFAFEPVNTAPLLGTSGAGTIGGMIAAGLAGPRRVKAGGARDHLLGAHAVSGFGDSFKTGGKVVKNVTGYDLCKLLAGSWGTLAAMIDVTIKTLPKPETEASVVVAGLDDARAAQAMAAVMGSSCDVSAAAHLPRNMVVNVDGLYMVEAATVFRLEGVAPSVHHRKAALTALLKPFGFIDQADESHSRTLWRSIRDAKPFWASAVSGEWPLWRVSTAPTRGHELASMLPDGAQWFYDWAGGLLWIALPPSDDGGAAAVRRAVAKTGGHATLIRAPAAVRAAVDVFQPQSVALVGVNKRVKESFDPKGVLNPGRMWAGV